MSDGMHLFRPLVDGETIEDRAAGMVQVETEEPNEIRAAETRLQELTGSSLDNIKALTSAISGGVEGPAATAAALNEVADAFEAGDLSMILRLISGPDAWTRISPPEASR